MMNKSKLSAVEQIKATSGYLRGDIADSLADTTTRFKDGTDEVLKFHGVYQGYNRDSATPLKQHGQDKAWQMMVRVRVPSGRLTPGQYLGLDDLGGRFGNGTLRLTTRQGIQFHQVGKNNLKPLIAEINQLMLSTYGACGDVVRNVMANPIPIKDAVHARLQDDALRLSTLFRPRSRAYQEIWLDNGKATESQKADLYKEVEPIYSPTYLPQQFKIAIATPDDNTVDVLTNDLAIIALFMEDLLLGYNFALGGGLGFTHNQPKTFATLARPICFVEADDLLPAAEAVVALLRDHGDRTNRRHARLKYLITEQGEAWTKSRLEESLGHPLANPVPLPLMEMPDLMGWHPQGDGRWFLGLPVPSGRISDGASETAPQLRTGLRVVIQKYWPSVILTPNQDILLADLPAHKRSAIEADLRRFNIRLADDLIPLERWALACPALPTCGLALAEAERVLPPVIDAIAEVMARYGLGRQRVSVRISGCANGCARSALADIGLVGRKPGLYQLYVGGHAQGSRLNQLLLDRVALAEVAESLEPLFALFAAERQTAETFGDFCHRIGLERLVSLIHKP